MAKSAEQRPVARGAKLSFNVAMWLTWARIGMIPLVVGVFYLPDAWLGIHGKNVVACALFSIAALTDAFDGWVARKYGLSTRLGAFLGQGSSLRNRLPTRGARGKACAGVKV